MRVGIVTEILHQSPRTSVAKHARLLVKGLLNIPYVEPVLIHHQGGDDPLYKEAEELLLPPMYNFPLKTLSTMSVLPQVLFFSI